MIIFIVQRVGVVTRRRIQNDCAIRCGDRVSIVSRIRRATIIKDNGVGIADERIGQRARTTGYNNAAAGNFSLHIFRDIVSCFVRAGGQAFFIDCQVVSFCRTADIIDRDRQIGCRLIAIAIFDGVAEHDIRISIHRIGIGIECVGAIGIQNQRTGAGDDGDRPVRRDILAGERDALFTADEVRIDNRAVDSVAISTGAVIAQHRAAIAFAFTDGDDICAGHGHIVIDIDRELRGVSIAIAIRVHNIECDGDVIFIADFRAIIQTVSVR